MHLSSNYKHRWGVVLAGGEGQRLQSLTRLVSGKDTPTKFALFRWSKLAHLLSAASDRLGVWCVGDLGWNDLGDPNV